MKEEMFLKHQEEDIKMISLKGKQTVPRFCRLRAVWSPRDEPRSRARHASTRQVISMFFLLDYPERKERETALAERETALSLSF